MSHETEPIYFRKVDPNREPSVFIGDTAFKPDITIVRVEGDLPTQSEIRDSVILARKMYLLRVASVASIPLSLLISKYILNS